MVEIHIIENGSLHTIEVPEDMNLSLMEVLKASGYPVAATCGGMALCATCRIEVKEGGELLPQPGDAELDMLDTLPEYNDHTRLACQIRIKPELSKVIWEYKPES